MNHKITNVDFDARTGLCSVCGETTLHNKGKSKNGRYNWRCMTKKKPYIRYRKKFCERCGFIPENMCQLDVDHIDGNNKNNSLDNLQTLCANCHRLKTRMSKDWEKRD